MKNLLIIWNINNWFLLLYEILKRMSRQYGLRMIRFLRVKILDEIQCDKSWRINHNLQKVDALEVLPREKVDLYELFIILYYIVPWRFLKAQQDFFCPFVEIMLKMHQISKLFMGVSITHIIQSHLAQFKIPQADQLPEHINLNAT